MSRLALLRNLPNLRLVSHRHQNGKYAKAEMAEHDANEATEGGANLANMRDLRAPCTLPLRSPGVQHATSATRFAPSFVFSDWS